MLESLFLNKISAIFAENRLLKFCFVILLVIAIYNHYTLKQAINSQKTIIVPAGLSSTVTIEGDSLPDEYVETMVRYIMSLAMNYTPATARHQFDLLLRLYESDAYSAASTLFYNLAGDVEAAKNTTSFFITKLTIDKVNHRIEVMGDKRQFTEQAIIPSSGSAKTYFIDYTVVNGKFMIKKFSEKLDS